MSERSEDDRNEPGSADLPETLEAAYNDVFRLIDMTQTREASSSTDEEGRAASAPPKGGDEDWPEPARPVPGVMRPRDAGGRRPSPAIMRRQVRSALKTIDMAIEAALDDPWGPVPASKPSRPSPYEGREY